MLKLLIVNEDMELGGAQRMAVVLANSLAKNPDIRVAFAAAEGALSRELDSRVPFHELPHIRSSKTIDVLTRLHAVISGLQPDIIHSHGATLGVLSSLARISAGCKAPRVLTHHSKVPRRLPRFAANLLFRGCFDHLVAISRHKHQDLLAAGLPEEMISLIPNFVTADRRWDATAVRNELGIPDGGAVVTIVGRLIQSKRCDLFIDILAATAGRTKRKLTGLIVGDGPELEDLKRKADGCKHLVDIRFLGYQKDVGRFLSATNVLLFPSEHPEVLPMTLIEASAMGVPIVCSNIAGNDEVVEHGRNGYLVSGDPEVYCQKLVSLLEDAGAAKAMSERGIRMAIDQFGEARVTSELIRMYRQLMAASTTLQDPDEEQAAPRPC